MLWGMTSEFGDHEIVLGTQRAWELTCVSVER